MSTIKSQPIKEAFVQSILEKQHNKRTSLFSYVEKIDWIDSLQFYQSGRALYAGERFFWKDRDGEVEIVGLGNIYTIRNEKTDRSRYAETEEKWNDMIKCSFIHNSFDAYGVGPVLFGGFSFDPKQEQEEEWSKFSSAFFYLPEYMLTIYEGECYLTTNVICPSDELEELIDKLESKKDWLLTQASAQQPDEHKQFAYIKEQNTEQWKKAVNEAVKQIRSDDELKKVVLARKIVAGFNQEIDQDNVLERLMKQQPDSFVFSLEAMESCFLGASPERLVRKRNDIALSTCLAGSIKRGRTDEEDDAFGKELLDDEKNRIEHDYVVQMIKREMEALCQTVNIPSAPGLMKVRDIQHLYTPVTGITDEGRSILQFVERLHPTPALGGLPNDKALPVIRRLEEMDRGFYAGPVGWMDYRKNGEFAVAIRSGLLSKQQAFLYAGCGIVADSEAESELAETRIKFRPMLRALGEMADE
ncbi:isochorismate synthase MenF [Bacillus badius]|uniref:isochorismate synthase n=1 Tax=Bacillus badius TaxID=1455 RepID=UPI00059783FF|nr:isochorismate synthase [Bacillus badius]KIL75731.1 Menaquinone-specific isochorismate synthase [Bacillus badius]